MKKESDLVLGKENSPSFELLIQAITNNTVYDSQVINALAEYKRVSEYFPETKRKQDLSSLEERIRNVKKETKIRCIFPLFLSRKVYPKHLRIYHHINKIMSVGGKCNIIYFDRFTGENVEEKRNKSLKLHKYAITALGVISTRLLFLQNTRFTLF